MSMLERNEPRITGQPGRVICASEMPASASAICCASVAGMETGDIAPMSRNGVMTTGWLARWYSRADSIMRSSQRSGELQLTSEMTTGACSMASRPPNAMSHIASVSRARSAETTLPMNGLSVSVSRRKTMSRWRESSGASLGSTIVPPAESSSSNACASWQKRSKSPSVASRRSAALAHEGRAVDAREVHVVAAEMDAARRVPRLHVVRAAAHWPPARARSRGRGRRCSPPPAGPRRGTARAPRGA